MNSNNKILLKEFKQILNTYITESGAEDLFKSLEEDISLKLNLDNQISKEEKFHLEYDLPKGINYRISVDKVITFCTKSLPEEKLYNLMLDLSQMMFFAGELPFSQELAEDLLSKINSNEKYSNLSAETNLILSKIFWAQAYWDDCNYFISQAMRIFKYNNNEPGIAKCENMLGTFYGEKGEFDKAQNHLENALKYLSNTDDSSTRAMIYTNLGILSTINEDYEKAIWNHKNAVEIFVNLKDVRRLARVYHNVGMLYTRMENYDAALDEFNKCITLSLDNDYLSNCAVAYIGKSYIYTKLKNPALADAYTEKAMEIAYKLNDTLSIADIYKVKGMIQNDMENFELSEELFENSIRLNQDIESKLNEAESADQLGKMLEKNNRTDEAKPYLQTAKNFFNEQKQENITAGLVAQNI
jgi:tetratricopeptide (TPR) repeat protein